MSMNDDFNPAVGAVVFLSTEVIALGLCAHYDVSWIVTLLALFVAPTVLGPPVVFAVAALLLLLAFAMMPIAILEEYWLARKRAAARLDDRA
jgi:hypothetical protein